MTPHPGDSQNKGPHVTDKRLADYHRLRDKCKANLAQIVPSSGPEAFERQSTSQDRLTWSANESFEVAHTLQAHRSTPRFTQDATTQRPSLEKWSPDSAKAYFCEAYSFWAVYSLSIRLHNPMERHTTDATLTGA